MLLGLIACALPAQAEWHLVLHTASLHAEQAWQGRWNEQNWGLGVRRSLGPSIAVQAGAYRNSEWKTSGYLVADWTPWHWKPLQAGVFGGLVSGYQLPVAAGLLVRAQGADLDATVRFVPKASRWGSAAMSLEFGWRF